MTLFYCEVGYEMSTGLRVMKTEISRSGGGTRHPAGWTLITSALVVIKELVNWNVPRSPPRRPHTSVCWLSGFSGQWECIARASFDAIGERIRATLEIHMPVDMCSCIDDSLNYIPLLAGKAQY